MVHWVVPTGVSRHMLAAMAVEEAVVGMTGGVKESAGISWHVMARG